MFAEQAGSAPEAIALVYEDEQMSYGELEKRSSQMGHHLKAMGVGPECVVGLCVGRSVEMVVAMLGILKAGGAYLPLDPTHPAERLKYMLEDAQAPVVVTGRSELALLSCYEGAKVCVDRDRGAIATQPVSEVRSGVTAENLVYVIYTSGSTGEPKGVGVPHRGLANLIRWHIVTYNLKNDDRATQLARTSFDAAAWEIWPVLTNGGSLHLASEQSLNSPAEVVNWFRVAGITTSFVPTPIAERLLDENLSAMSLRHLLTGGDQLRRFAAKALPFALHNHYGPTECTVVSTCCQVGAGVSPEAALPPIGRPVANMKTYVLDGQLNPTPVGVVGELYLGGAGVARGYVGKPEQTAEHFVPQPFQAGGERLYRTGDLVKWRGDGNLEFVGRGDHQVKIRGFRIELGEIEARLLEYPAVREAVVLARDGDAGDKRLVAYYTVSPGQDREAMKTEELRTHLLSRLPEYMTPAVYVRLESLPLAPNGKLDRKALPEAGAYASRDYEAPVGEVEQILARLWAELFKLDRVGRHDNFFELGGNSIVSIQLADGARKAGVTVAPRDLFQYQTVGELAAKVSGSGNAEFPASKTTEAVRDLSAEVVIDAAIAATAERRIIGEAANVLLTGASGFLGAFLLFELLKRTQAKIYCLIRSSDLAEAQVRISSQLKAFELWDESLSARIVPVPGDLSKPRLGLPPEQFDELAEVIDVIYHNGAAVNSVYPYHVLKPANVLGTHEILRIASCRRVKPVHFVSTLSVFPPPNGAPPASMTTEAQLLENWQGLSSGYSQSKWVAEQMVRMAGSRGIPIAIYRPSFISGSTRTGAVNPNDSLTHFIRACMKSGCVPDIDTEINMVPVDYISRAVVALSGRNYVLGHAWNLINMRSVSMQEVSSCFLSSGLPMRKVTYEEWQSRCSSNGAKAALLNFHSSHSNKNQKIVFPEDLKIGIVNTLSLLEAEGIRCPIITPQLLRSYISYLRVHEDRE
ncbi:MAG TPA: amino acid adenylation domain-containing protein [Blastocatellia bacterium]|nr:amino acid adenylation domain-containing protein [Blastocatellia bacterium]